MKEPGSNRRTNLNLTAGAWRQLRAAWNLPATPALCWQSLVAGSVFSALERIQAGMMRRRGEPPSLAGSIVVLGYWRSGTTLLHQYLSLDRRYGYPTTYACFNPHHFLLTGSSVQARGGAALKRPMDDVLVTPESPQEDEFALLALGARSPYEALLASASLDQCLALADPRNLTSEERRRWSDIFVKFLSSVSMSQGRRPLIVKSPPHGYRIAILRDLLPDARFVLIVRDPFIVFESAVRMWRSLFETYAMTEPPTEEAIRETVLADRQRFETQLSVGIGELPRNQLTLVRYEALVSKPVDTLASLYESLGLGDFDYVADAIAEESLRRRDHLPSTRPPTEPWRHRVATAWRDVFERYGYAAR